MVINGKIEWVGFYAFTNSSTIIKTIEFSNATIENNTFNNCKNLSEIKGTISNVKEEAFIWCPSLSGNITIADQATIGEKAFLQQNYNNKLNIVIVGEVSE